jgi:hypothetical protein
MWAVVPRGYFTKNTRTAEDCIPIIQKALSHDYSGIFTTVDEILKNPNKHNKLATNGSHGDSMVTLGK